MCYNSISLRYMFLGNFSDITHYIVGTVAVGSTCENTHFNHNRIYKLYLVEENGLRVSQVSDVRGQGRSECDCATWRARALR